MHTHTHESATQRIKKHENKHRAQVFAEREARKFPRAESYTHTFGPPRTSLQGKKDTQVMTFILSHMLRRVL